MKERGRKLIKEEISRENKEVKQEVAKSRQALQESENILMQEEEIVKADLKYWTIQHQNVMMPFQQQLPTNYAFL